MKYYILAWHDEGETNRAETIWEGYDPKEARSRFNQAEFIGNIFFFEVWASSPELAEDARLEYKTI